MQSVRPHTVRCAGGDSALDHQSGKSVTLCNRFPLLPSVTVYTLHKVTNSSYTVNHCMVTPGNAYTLQKVIKSVLCAPTAGLSTPIHPVVLSRMSRHICRSSIKVRQYGIHVFPRIAQKTALLYTNPDGNGIRWKPGAVPPL